jgi:hypothetical protein
MMFAHLMIGKPNENLAWISKLSAFDTASNELFPL